MVDKRYKGTSKYYRKQLEMKVEFIYSLVLKHARECAVPLGDDAPVVRIQKEILCRELHKQLGYAAGIQVKLEEAEMREAAKSCPD